MPGRFRRVRLCGAPRLQPNRLLCPGDSPGKNTGVGCHALPQGNRPHPGTELPSLYSSCAGRWVLHLQRHVGSPSSLGYAVKALACGKPVVPGLRSVAPCLSVSHTVMCLCQSHNPVILIYPPLASPVATISWFSLSASLFLFDKQVHLYYSLDS